MRTRSTFAAAVLAAALIVGCGTERGYESLPFDDSITDMAVDRLSVNFDGEVKADADFSNRDGEESMSSRVAGWVRVAFWNVGELDRVAVVSDQRLDYESVTTAMIENLDGETRAVFDDVFDGYYTDPLRPTDGKDAGFFQQRWDMMLLAAATYAANDDGWAEFFTDGLNGDRTNAGLVALFEGESDFSRDFRRGLQWFRRGYETAVDGE